MFKAVVFFAVLSLLLHTSCQQATTFKKINSSSFIIDVQPFSDIPATEVNYVVTELKKVYPTITIKNAIPLPQFAYYKLRNRYRADSLIQFLDANTLAQHVTIGLTNKDISAAKDSIADWGVMGLGFCPGKACIASSFRLSKSEKLMQLFKVAIHKLGHTQGLPHCTVKNCFMRDAEGRNPTDEEKDFCVDCKKQLEKKGWSFSNSPTEKK
jgi:archaemetzincin